MAKLAWTLGWWGIFMVGILWWYFFGISDESWITFWWWKIMITVVVAVGTTIWFCIGGLYDIKDLFHTLRTMKRDHLDVGMVRAGHNLEDEETAPAVVPIEDTDKSDALLR